MHDKGMAATTVEGILTACGAGRSQLYHYFQGKDARCAAMLEHQLARVLAAQPSLTDKSCAAIGV